MTDEERGVRVHELKSWPETFRKVVAGAKCAEWRRDDRDYRPGDLLLLREWDPETSDPDGSGHGHIVGGAYTGEAAVAIVTDVLRGSFDVPRGYAVLSIVLMAVNEGVSRYGFAGWEMRALRSPD